MLRLDLLLSNGLVKRMQNKFSSFARLNQYKLKYFNMGTVGKDSAQTSLKLTIHKAQDSDIKRGCIRLNFKARGKEIKREGIYKIQNNDAFVYRMVLGNDRESDEKFILIDRYTRDLLNIDLDVEYTLKFRKARLIERICCFYWKHPDYTFRVGYRLAWILGGISVILGFISVIFSLII